MPEYYSHLADTLRRRLDLIADKDLREKEPARQLAELQKVSNELEEAKLRLPFDADPMLKHYLEKMSLSKALDFLEARRSISSPPTA